MTRETPRPGRYGWYLAALLALAHLVSFVDRNLVGMLAEPLKARHGLSDAGLGLLQGTSFVLLYSLAAIPLGLAADRVSRRGLIAVGLVVWSAATALCGLANSIGGLFAARVLVGLGEAALVPAAMSLLAAQFPQRQLGRAVSLFTGGASLGKAAALAGGGALLGWFTATGAGALEPWQAVFVAMAVPGLVLALAMTTVREPARPAPRQGLLRDAFTELRARHAAWLRHGGAAACIVLVIQTLAAWSPSFYAREFGGTPTQAGIATGAALLVAAPLGHLAGGALTDWLCRRSAAPAAPVMAVALATALAGLALMLAAPTMALSVVGFGLVNFCATLGAPAALAGVQMLAPDRLRGTLTSLFVAGTTLVALGLGPVLVGLASDAGGGLRIALAAVLGGVGAIGIALALASRAPFAAANRPAQPAAAR